MCSSDEAGGARRANRTSPFREDKDKGAELRFFSCLSFCALVADAKKASYSGCCCIVRELFGLSIGALAARPRTDWPSLGELVRADAKSSEICSSPVPATEKRDTKATAFCATLAVSNGRFLNPQGGLHVYKNPEGPISKLRNSREWELPVGATADLLRNEPAISCSPGLAGRLNRCLGRFG